MNKNRTLIVISFLTMAASIMAMDQARIETRVEDAVAKYGVSGKGVIVAILDRGIDWQNNDFRNPDGTTRIKWIFDLTDDAGATAAGNTFGKGTIYSEAQINAALTGGPLISHRDGVGHGTTTAGIAAGNGRNVAKYRGVAPEASLIIVKVTTEGAPAHDGQPAEAPFNDSSRFPLAIDFVKAKAAELKMPCVMLLNLGSSGGPTDGTSNLARKIDATVGAGIPGLAFVTGPGDDGGAPNRAGGTVAKGSTASIQIQKTQTGSLDFDLWYPAGATGTDNFTVTIRTPSGTFGPFAPPATEGASDVQTGGGKFDYRHLGANVNFANATNGKREIFIRFFEGVGSYSVELNGAGLSSDRRFDATLNPSEFFQNPSPNAFTTYNAPGSIWDGASALHNICPGDYVHRTQWVDIDGIARSNFGQGEIGEIWQGSSTGPTFDGRLGVDLTAPGDSVFATSDPKSYRATFRFNLIQDGAGLYVRFNAVSAAAPQVTGAIALMLQENPQLDAAQIKKILQTSARADSFTGAIPNTTWGYGKLDVLAALDAVNGTLPKANLQNIATRLNVLNGDKVLIGGFIITGSAPKKVLLRAIGPSLANFGVNGALADPTLELHKPDGTIVTNDNWKINDATGQSQEAEIRATTIPPNNDLESAIIATLAPGPYTAIVSGKGGGTGIGLVEAYDLDPAAPSQFGNIATRGLVDTGNNVMIGGFIIGPNTAGNSKVVVRGIGPSLTAAGVPGALQDPTLELHDGNGAKIAFNDNWQDDAGAAEVKANMLDPKDPGESALLRTLAPGGYTAIVAGSGNTTGVGLVEVYNVK